MATLACAMLPAAKKARPIRATRGERISIFGLQALTRDDTDPSPALIMHKRPLCFQWLRRCIVNAPNGANKADARPNPARAQPFGSGDVNRAPFRLNKELK